MGLLANIGRVFRGKPVGASRRDEIIAQLWGHLRALQASYDAARNSDELKSHWANADAFDADSAHSRGVRENLVKRSRLELANNGYADGIAQTFATDLVGVGPLLRMQTASQPFNQMVEREWYLWTKATQFRRKLWCMAHAKYGDGESLGVLRLNKRIKHRIPLDVCLYETEQCQTPFIPFNEPGYIDGIKFDEFGNPLWYDILKQHPGASNQLGIDLIPERVPANRVLHWFKMRRPRQHRGVPECASTLNLGAMSRRLRTASVVTAEKIAAWTLLFKSTFEPAEDDEQAGLPLELFDIIHGMATMLPDGIDPVQLKAEQPGPNYESFHKLLVNEFARPKSMPYNKAACDSSSYNYASGRLDHQTYYAGLDVEREDGNDLVLDPLFDAWFDLAIEAFGWLGGDASAVGPSARAHLWDWPKHRVADVESEANANETKLKSGQISLPRLYTDAGMDLDDEVPAMARAYGVDESEIRRRLLDVHLPPAKAEPAAPSAESIDEAVEAMFRNYERRSSALGHVNGNGAHHAN